MVRGHLSRAITAFPIVQDTERDSIAKHLAVCFGFIDNARQAGGSVMVHCLAGVSRTGAVIVSYLMHHCRYNACSRAVSGDHQMANPTTEPLSAFPQPPLKAKATDRSCFANALQLIPLQLAPTRDTPMLPPLLSLSCMLNKGGVEQGFQGAVQTGLDPVTQHEQTTKRGGGGM